MACFAAFLSQSWAWGLAQALRVEPASIEHERPKLRRLLQHLGKDWAELEARGVERGQVRQTESRQPANEFGRALAFHPEEKITRISPGKNGSRGSIIRIARLHELKHGRHPDYCTVVMGNGWFPDMVATVPLTQ